MRRALRILIGAWMVMATMAAAAPGQTPYIGFVFPAGAQQGTTATIRLGGQRLDGLSGVRITGEGVQARLVEYRRVLNAQETPLLREQVRILRQQLGASQEGAANEEAEKMVERIEERLAEQVPRPACASIANIVIVEVTVAPDAPPGPREIRLVTLRGITNPMVFHVGQLPEVVRPPLPTCPFPVLGKEEDALRPRPIEDVERQVDLPCTVNGQISPGQVNRYRFAARKGQRLVISAQARQLVPYIADAVPGWFQAVLALHDSLGSEVAYNDDYRFHPDPVILLEVPADGEYVLTVSDALYRGREDFVYRISIGELPFITSIFPLGGRAGHPPEVEVHGWNLPSPVLALPATDAAPGIYSIAATQGGMVSNPVPFALDELPEALEQEPNGDRPQAQAVELPVIVNGRIGQPGDWDVFRFEGRAGDTVVAEVHARRLDSPLDSILKLTDSQGRILALNDDSEDFETGLHTHHADSYLMATLPEDGAYYVHLGDTTQSGGEEYAYRLRLSAPMPDFALRAVPSGVAMRGNSAVSVNVYAIRKDGFTGPIRLALKDPPEGILASAATLAAGAEMVRFTVRNTLESLPEPVRLTIEGRAEVDGREIVRTASAAEDRMQAFLWRHLVPSEEFLALVFDPTYEPPPQRIPPPAPPREQLLDPDAPPPMFTKAQVAGRLRMLRQLYDEHLLTDDLYHRKVAECETVAE